MRKTYQVFGYAVNKRGHTVGIYYTMTSSSVDTAKDTAQLLALQGGYKLVRITTVREADHE